MKVAFNIPPRSLVAITVIVGALMIVSAFWELEQSRRELAHVVQEEALSLVETIHQGSVNTILASEQLERFLTERLLNNAWFIARLDSLGLLTHARLAQIAHANNIFRINLFDRNGAKVLSSHLPSDEHSDIPAQHLPADILSPILHGEKGSLVIGLKDARFEDGQRYAVAIRRLRPGGGAIVLNLDAAELLEFRKRIGIGRLIRDLGDNSGIEYVALQDEDGIIAASGAVTELSSFAADSLLPFVTHKDTTVMREISFGSTSVIEVLHPLILENTTAGVLRIGLSMDEIRATEARMQRRMMIVSLVLVLLGILVTIAIVAGRNYRRVEAELQRRETLSALGELASGVAHEIRNPLNAIAMIAQRFEKEFSPRNGAEEFAALTGVLRSEARRVNGIVQQFLRFSRPAPLQVATVHTDEFIAHLAAIFREEATAHGVAFRAESECTEALLIDRDQMTQAVLNLLQNALHATPTGGTITLLCSASDTHVSLTVTDTGGGIPDAARKKIFNLYYTTRPDGTGMGLPMAQQIVAQHHGEIDVESAVGRGSRFTIRLPRYGGAGM